MRTALRDMQNHRKYLTAEHMHKRVHSSILASLLTKKLSVGDVDDDDGGAAVAATTTMRRSRAPLLFEVTTIIPLMLAHFV
jgi:hypothetical protein